MTDSDTIWERDGFRLQRLPNDLEGAVWQKLDPDGAWYAVVYYDTAELLEALADALMEDYGLPAVPKQRSL